MITDVHHVGIAVRDMEAALRFYAEALRLPVVKQGEASARGAQVALVAVGGSYLELVQPTRDDSPFAEHIAEQGEGLHHVALGTDDVRTLVAALRAKGVPLQDAEPREGFTGRLSYLAPEAMDGALLEVVQPPRELSGGSAGDSPVSRIDHVVLRLPDVEGACGRMREYFGVETKRTFERGEMRFSFLRPGEVILELIGPKKPPSAPRPGSIAGLAFEVTDIDALAADLKGRGLPVGEPHPALQGGRIVSVHASGACGVPVAFIDFSDSPR
ncbi:MAG: VOC family protein [Chloroflexi bacterium]|nr:VOC family protein [Chloroflexota bacterium]